MRSTPTDAARFEAVEAAAVTAVLESAAPEARDRMGIRVARVAGATLTMVRESAGRSNRVIALGTREPITRDGVARIVDTLRAHGTPSSWWPIAPTRLPPDWDEIVDEFGLVPSEETYKLVGDAAEVARAAIDTDLRIGPILPDAIEDAAGVLATVFGWQRRRADDLFGQQFRVGTLRGFAAWHGDEMVAVGAAAIVRDAVEFVGAATLPGWRGRGAQSALVVARAAAGVEAGCTTVLTEVEVLGPGERNPSLSVLERRGLRPAYIRPSWMWHRDAS